MTVRAKFKVVEVTQYEQGSKIKLYPVTGGSPENEQFFKWTPTGEISMGTINPEAAKEFVIGGEVYVDFTPIKQ